MRLSSFDFVAYCSCSGNVQGPTPSIEEPQGPYPVVRSRENGSRALVVQDFAQEVHGIFKYYPEILEILEPYGLRTSSLYFSFPIDPEIVKILELYRLKTFYLFPFIIDPEILEILESYGLTTLSLGA
ncbi:hypothetical protein CEXT_699181 [Caerostris extrusa]|uniref:Uncharacterized protein n=1 Tax=Caerostris extrusa TaxID=172846 RepID=A0AAV4UVG9_CAEEX|nr:hypothetical protein CEXT_699181 [Caerostris extrusa]